MKFFLFGVVQGVGFRPTVYRVATSLGCTGYVRNNGSNVEVCLDGRGEEFLEKLMDSLPPLAKIERVEEVDEPCEERSAFEIIGSTSGSREASIPPDIGICDECFRELFDPNNRRYMFPFTNCTNCGARFSLIKDFPYDRSNTSMAEFVLCEECLQEYTSPLARRFHAQTISCPHDGPSYTAYDSNGNAVDAGDPISWFSKKLDSGSIGVLKGWGGMHIVCRLDSAMRLREWYGRPSKPFAVMVRDVEAARKYAKVSENARALLTSPQSPILLLPKKEGKEEMLEAVSPGLKSVGLYLPYSGIQKMLFYHIKEDAIIMTSANPPGEPMAIMNDDAFRLKLDAYLLHNRAIVNRIDDSVILPYRENHLFIRKSRGYVPQALEVPYSARVLGVGAERNVTSSLSREGKLYLSQYVGNSRHHDVLLFQEDATKSLMNLTGIDTLQAVAMDMHPLYPTRRFAKEMASSFEAELVEVQHHWAHALSLMVDRERYEESVDLTVDGMGYGEDGNIWGGEVLFSTPISYKRIAHLENIPLIGGDAATLEPLRIVFGIFERLNRPKRIFEERKEEVLRKAMEKAPLTSSFGRVLDALSAYLGICERMTYDGEPAMKLERYLAEGKPKFDFETESVGSSPATIKTLSLFNQLEDFVSDRELNEGKKANLAHSFVLAIMKEFVENASLFAEENGISEVGITGGIAYDIPILRMFERLLSQKGMKAVMHKNVPCGDGGISVGQNLFAGLVVG